jgi:RHS repeat-associated protein
MQFFVFGLFLLTLLLPAVSYSRQPTILNVNRNDPNCGGQTPCFTRIQAAVDAAQPGDIVRIHAGTYTEQVTISNKNSTAHSTELHRIVIEIDPSSPVGSVVLHGSHGGDDRNDDCEREDRPRYGIMIRDSRFITIRGLTITEFSGPAVWLAPDWDRRHHDSRASNVGVHIELNRIFRNAERGCNGGIVVSEGNRGTLIVNNLLYGNGGNAVTFERDGGGPHYVFNNSIYQNMRNGVEVARGQEVYLVNNIINRNGTHRGDSGERYGVNHGHSRHDKPKRLYLLNNIICGNARGELDGRVLDRTDAANLTPRGNEGPGISARAGCEVSGNIFNNVSGVDGVPNTEDDDFALKRGSFAIDMGADPRTLRLDPALDAVFLADYLRDGVLRPQDGDGDGIARFDAGAVEFVGDFSRPTVVFLSPAENSHVRQTVPITVQATDNEAVAALTLRAGSQKLAGAVSPRPPAASVTATAWWKTTIHKDGAAELSASAMDQDGNIGKGARSVIIDNTPPDTRMVSGPESHIEQTTAIFKFGGVDNLTPTSALTYSWRIDGASFTAFSADTTAIIGQLAPGSHVFEVIARDLAGNLDATPASWRFTVRLGPTVTGMDPPSGPVGSLVTISGDDFEPGLTQVAFNGVAATVREITATSISTTVPLQASTGPVTVTTTRGSAQKSFAVEPSQSFTLRIGPANVQTVRGEAVAILIESIPTGGFGGLIQLTTGSLPLGTTAKFLPAFLAPNASAVLTLGTTTSTPTGAHVVEIRASAQIDGQTIVKTGRVTLNVASPGQTILTGQILDGSERPLAGVSIKLGGSSLVHLGTSDEAGNLFIPLSISGPQVFLIDGSTANTATVQYSTIPITLDIRQGVVNELGYIPRLGAQPVAKLTPIVPGQATVITDANLPGFKMTIPAGVQVIGWDGKPNTQFGVTTVPIDRSPLPPLLLPPGFEARQTYIFSFGKMGGGVPSGNIPIDTPNDVEGLPGDNVDLYYFNEAPDGSAPNQWEKYGTGTVSQDGTTIVTDINPATGLPYGIPRFCCGARTNVIRRFLDYVFGGPSGGPRDGGKKAGDPVDVSTGFFYLDKTDMVLSGRIPIVVTRTYRSNQTNQGPFGIGSSWPFDITLATPPNGSTDAFILVTPGNRQDVLSRQSFTTFGNTTSPWLRGAVFLIELARLQFKDGGYWQFDSAGRLQSQTDRNGNTIQLSRDAQGRIVRIGVVWGHELTVNYTGPTVSSITDPAGRKVRYDYDNLGRLETVTDPAGGVTRYTYDSAHRMLSITDARGIIFLTNEYDANGRVLRQTQADGGVWRFEYNGTGGSMVSHAVVTDPRGHATIYRFNSAGYLVSETNALGQTVAAERQVGTNLLLSVTDFLEGKTRFEYDTTGNVTKITDSAGNVRGLTYHSAFNQVTSITDPLGQATRLEYGNRRNPIAAIDPLGNRTMFAYNNFGQLTTITDPLGNTTSFAYDSDNLTAITDPLGNSSQRRYDEVSRLISQTNPRGKKTTFAYDPLDRLVRVTDPAAGLTEFAYDANGNLLSVTDARGSMTRYTYDNMDRLATRTDPLGAVESYQYDFMGNLTEHIDRKGQRTSFIYDPLNRRIGGNYADGANTTFTYDVAGRLIEATDSAGGTISNHYDNLDRLVAQISNLGTVSYEYDIVGRRTRMSVPGQIPVTYAYDAASRLRQIVQGANVVGLDYDAVGRRTSLMLPNGISTEYQYDSASRLTALVYRNASAMLGDLTYQYDKAGNRTGVGGSFAHTLLPDAIGSASYDAANRQLQLADKTITFDANGNLTSIAEPSGTTTYTWDARNRLVGLSSPNATASFGYDVFDRRSQKVINGQRINVLYDRINPVQESSGVVVVANTLTGLSIDEYLARTDSTGAWFFLADALGSTLALTDNTGAIRTQYSYEAFGKTAASGAPSGNPFQYTGRENDGSGLYYYRARFYNPTSHRFVAEDPLNLVNSQVYANDESREPVASLLFQDQFRLGDSYGYVVNNPLLYVDPLGLTPSVAQLIHDVVLGMAGSAIENGIDGNPLESTIGGLFGGLAGLVPVAGVPGAIVGGTFGFSSGIATEAVANPNASLGDLVIGGIAGAAGGAIGGYAGGYRGMVGGTTVGIAAKKGLQIGYRCYIKKKC